MTPQTAFRPNTQPSTPTEPDRPSTRPAHTRAGARPWWHFLRHSLEMLVAMGIGMVLLAPAWSALFAVTGLSRYAAGPELTAFVAATDMTVAMAVWMSYRGHGRRHLLEMGAAMSVPYVLTLVPYWFGLLSRDDVLMGGHLLMVPAMAGAMLLRRSDYSHPSAAGRGSRPLVATVARRWPTWLALALTMDNWTDPSVPNPWVLLLLPAAYLVIGAVRGRLRGHRELTLQLGGLAVCLVLAVLASGASPDTAAWLVAGGWAFHGLWDAVHHRRANSVVPRAYAEWCGVIDLVIAVSIVVFW